MKKRISLLLLAGTLVFAPIFSQQKISDRKVQKIHESVLTVDTHTDTPMRLGSDGFDVGKRNDPYKTGSKVDFPRMKEGGLDAIFFAVFVGQGERTAEGNRKARELADHTFEQIHNQVKKYSDQAELALEPDDAYRIEKTGKRAVYIGLENGYPIGNDLALVDTFYARGARYITLCHTANNDICDSSTDPNGPEYHGLSAFGEQVVARMNQLGIMVDVSHISDESFYDVINLSKVPVIASHSGAREVCNSPRNLDDDMLRALAQNDGVVQVCFVPSYVREMPPNPARDSAQLALRKKYGSFRELDEATRQEALKEWYELDKNFPQQLPSVSDLVDHIDHIVQVAGITHVGIGTDFDGGGVLSDCFDVSQMQHITRELLRRGYTKKEIGMIWGGNFMRVFREVRAASESPVKP